MPEWSKIHEIRGFGLIAIPLAILSCVYRAALYIRLLIGGKKQVKELPGFVVSIGNITTGGTGKTPATRLIADLALKQGYSPAVLSRGYGGRYKTKVLVVSDGNDINAGPEDAGDEPYLLARWLKGIPVVVSRDRYSAGLLANKRFGSDFFILDDGFQHIQLKRNLDILLVDASSPFGNGHLLPWGPLREPLSRMKKADVIIITRSDPDSFQQVNASLFKGLFNDMPVFRSSHVPYKVVFPDTDTVHDAEFLKGKTIAAFAGIARPEAFRQTLERLEANVAGFRGFVDHHGFTRRDIENLKSLKIKVGAEYILTTEKDWVRLEHDLYELSGLAYLTVKFSILSGLEDLVNIIKEKIEKKEKGIV